MDETKISIDGEAAISEIAESVISEVMETAEAQTGTSEISESEITETESENAETKTDITEAETEIITTEVSAFPETVNTESVVLDGEVLTVLPPETTAAITEVAAEVSSAAAIPSSVQSDIPITPERIIMPVIIGILAIMAFAMKKKSSVKKSDRKKAQRILTRSGLKKASQSRLKRKALNFLRIRKSEIFQKRCLTQCRTKKYCRIIYGISAGRCIPRRTPLTI